MMGGVWKLGGEMFTIANNRRRYLTLQTQKSISEWIFLFFQTDRKEKIPNDLIGKGPSCEGQRNHSTLAERIRSDREPAI